MSDKNMTALVSCFARAYHYKNNECRIFSDDLAKKIITPKEYNDISLNMSKGIMYFNPTFKGTDSEALRWIVDNQLSPSVLGRSAFCEKSLFDAVANGCRQYLIFASGYDTFAYRNSINDLMVFEIDRANMIEDKKHRLANSNIESSEVRYISCDFSDKDWINEIIRSDYNRNKVAFCSLLGISYYLKKDEFYDMIRYISSIVCDGSFIVFDYPTFSEEEESRRNRELAKEAGEDMKSKYLYDEIEKVLSKNGFTVFNHLNDKKMTEYYFKVYNNSTTEHKIKAPTGVNYCLARKEERI